MVELLRRAADLISLHQIEVSDLHFHAAGFGLPARLTISCKSIPSGLPARREEKFLLADLGDNLRLMAYSPAAKYVETFEGFTWPPQPAVNATSRAR